MEFNKKSIDQAVCPEGKGAIYLTDPSTRGLYVQITQAGTKTFVYRRKIGPTWQQRTIARIEDMKIPEARAVASDYNARLARGVSVFEQARAAREEPTFRDLFETYLSEHAETNCTTASDMRKNFDRWFCDLANKKASAITHGKILDLHREMKTGNGQRKAAPYAANRAVQLGRAIYNLCIRMKYVSCENPFAGVSLSREKARNRFLSHEEVGKLLRHLRDASTMDDDARRLRDFVLLDIFTGARKSALLSAEWDEFDLRNGTWTIPYTKAKNKEEQVIPLGPDEIKILEERYSYLRSLPEHKEPKKLKFVFPGEGSTGHVVDLKRSWATLRKKLGFKDRTNVTIHDLRRSLGATMASLNVGLALIGSVLHHKDLKTTQRHYAHTGKAAELEAKQLAHSVWLEAERTVPEQAEETEEASNVVPLEQETAKIG